MVILSIKRLAVSLSIMITITIILTAAGLGLNSGKEWYLNLASQKFFFWGIAALAVQLWIGASLLFNQKKLAKSIKRLATFEDYNNPNADRAFTELGIVGEELKRILIRENQLSVMRADRISGQNNLITLLCDGYSDPIAVTDVNGGILTISGKLKTRLTKEIGRTDFSNIVELYPQLKIPEILGYIEKQRSSWKDAENSGIECTPIFGKNNTVQLCIWELETSFFAGKIKEFSQQKAKITPRYKKLKDFINPFKKKKP